MKPLRERMMEDPQLKGYSESTQKLYVSSVRQLCEHVNKPLGNNGSALKYLAPYIHRVAITNNRIETLENDKVIFRFKNSATDKWETASLPAFEFIHRFPQHVLPKGFVKIRYYGLLAPTGRTLLAVALYLPGASRTLSVVTPPPKKTMSVLAADHRFGGSNRWEESHVHHLGEKDVLKNSLVFRLFSVKEATWKVMCLQGEFSEYWQKIGQFGCDPKCQRTISDRSLSKTVLLDDDGRCEPLNSPRKTSY